MNDFCRVNLVVPPFKRKMVSSLSQIFFSFLFIIISSNLGCFNGFAVEPEGKIVHENFLDRDDCQIQNCHGLDVSCGKGEQLFCSAVYMLGDFCRQYAKCAVMDGSCHLVSDDTFLQCKACVEQCFELKDVQQKVDCELKCREQIERNTSEEIEPGEGTEDKTSIPSKPGQHNYIPPKTDSGDIRFKGQPGLDEKE